MNAATIPTDAPRWDLERIELLRHHFAVGLTAAESAVLLGGVTKNAVISKRHRLGLVGLARSASAALPSQRFPTRIRHSKFRFEPTFQVHPLPIMEAGAPTGANPKPLTRHQRGECIWPLGPAQEPGDWRTLFCCAPIKGPGRYCVAHAARARR